MMIDTNSGESATSSIGQTPFLVGDDPVINTALELVNIIRNTGKITIKGKGERCPNAVSIANIITENMLKDNSKTQRITIDSDMTYDGQLISTIEIVIIKIN